jgi:hypothetical protein
MSNMTVAVTPRPDTSRRIQFLDGERGFIVEAPHASILSDLVKFDAEGPRPMLTCNADERAAIIAEMDAAESSAVLDGGWFERARDAIREWPDSEVASSLHVPLELVCWMRVTSHGWYVHSVFHLVKKSFDGDFGAFFNGATK